MGERIEPETIPLLLKVRPDVIELMATLIGPLYGRSIDAVALSLIRDALKRAYPTGRLPTPERAAPRSEDGGK